VESAIEGDQGFAVTIATDLPDHIAMFSESASRAVVGVAPEYEATFTSLAESHGVLASRLGETGGPRVVFAGMFEATVAELREVHETAIPRLLGEAV
jgi:phosphoribosylformylglycinamidine synthase subunit PurL